MAKVGTGTDALVSMTNKARSLGSDVTVSVD